jgi:hypothetical protein
MNDKEFLEKVNHLYNIYSNDIGPKLDIENFITWIYKQYGFLEPKKDKNEDRI